MFGLGPIEFVIIGGMCLGLLAVTFVLLRSGHSQE
jgi:hypothetical protein